MRRRPPARTQITVCYQAVAQYPESFNDHKETHRRLPLGSAVNAYAFSVDHWLLDTSTRSYRANKTLGGPVPLPIDPFKRSPLIPKKRFIKFDASIFDFSIDVAIFDPMDPGVQMQAHCEHFYNLRFSRRSIKNRKSKIRSSMPGALAHSSPGGGAPWRRTGTVLPKFRQDRHGPANFFLIKNTGALVFRRFSRRGAPIAQHWHGPAKVFLGPARSCQSF